MPKIVTESRARASRDTLTKSRKPKDPKASHLYTDDNPATTIHGTGFKDKAAAIRTLELIRKRSLTYQFQTVNTMYHRAKHHPVMKKSVEGSAKTADIRAAMEVFREWLDVTLPEQRSGLRAEGFKPLLSKEIVKQYFPSLLEDQAVSDDGKAFADVYIELPKAKRLGNVLVDQQKPMEADWERRRYEALDSLVSAGREKDMSSWQRGELWNHDRRPTSKHLEMIAWAWSPAPLSSLKP